MTDPVKVYAVVSGEYSDYSVHAIFRRREDAEAYASTESGYAIDIEEFDYYEGEATPKPVRGTTSGNHLSESEGSEHA